MAKLLIFRGKHEIFDQGSEVEKLPGLHKVSADNLYIEAHWLLMNFSISAQ